GRRSGRSDLPSRHGGHRVSELQRAQSRRPDRPGDTALREVQGAAALGGRRRRALLRRRGARVGPGRRRLLGRLVRAVPHDRPRPRRPRRAPRRAAQGGQGRRRRQSGAGRLLRRPVDPAAGGHARRSGGRPDRRGAPASGARAAPRAADRHL
ncbi:MAG: Thioredoxin, partial [uncultured Solirubrobacteraceae bacterium]